MSHWFARSLLTSPVGYRQLCGLSIVSLAMLAGCEPEKPLSSGSTLAESKVVGTNSTKSAGEAQGKAANKPTPQGPITVDQDGFVTLGSEAGLDAGVEVSETITAGAETKSSRTQAASTDNPLRPATPTSALELAATQSESSTPDAPQTGAVELRAANTIAARVSSTLSLDGKKTPGLDSSKQTEADAAIVKFDEKNQQIAENWPKPQALLFITGQQHGYIEPCGCTGLVNQKGGLNRRDTLLTQLRERGWDVVPMDVGNFERRTGIQAELKLQTTVKALNEMQYRAVTLGVDDLKLSSQELLNLTASEGKVQTPFISANAYVLVEEYMAKFRIIEAGGRKIGVTAVLSDSFASELKDSTDIITAPAAESLRKVIAEMKSQKCDYLVLLSHAKLAESRQLAVDVPGFDLIVSAGDYPEPDFTLEEIENSPSKLVQVGAKGMFTALVGLYPDSEQPVRYQRIALSSQFADSPRMMELFAGYQKQLEDKGFEGLRIPVQALEGDLKFVGSESCGDCHTTAFEVWKSSEHANATESLVHPPNSRSMIPRHFDPECLSCHVTGWNPQRYYPYSSGFASLATTPNLTGNGCENCHGAGSAHVAAESGDTKADEETLKALREKMRLPLAEAKERCIQCHDQDNSPDFHHEGAFEKYWAEVAHSGKD